MAEALEIWTNSASTRILGLKVFPTKHSVSLESQFCWHQTNQLGGRSICCDNLMSCNFLIIVVAESAGNFFTTSRFQNWPEIDRKGNCSAAYGLPGVRILRSSQVLFVDWGGRPVHLRKGWRTKSDLDQRKKERERRLAEFWRAINKQGIFLGQSISGLWQILCKSYIIFKKSDKSLTPRSS